MNDLKLAFRLPLENPSLASGATSLRRGLLSRPLGAVVRRNLEARDQHDVHSLIMVGFVMPENEHLASAGGQGDEIRMFHQQTATVSHVNEKRAERLRVKQLPDVIRFHLVSITVIPHSRKCGGPFEVLFSLRSLRLILCGFCTNKP